MVKTKLPKHGVVPVAILLDQEITLADLKVYTALSSFQGSNDDAYPSREKIVERCGLALETVSRAVSHLVERGWVERKRRPNATSIYRVLFETEDDTEVTATSLPGSDSQVTPEVTATSLPSIKQKDHLKRIAKTKHKHGEFSHVLLTDEDLEKLKAEYPLDWQERIKRLDEYIEMKGPKKASYANHLLTIRNWAKRDVQKPSGLFDQPNHETPMTAMSDMDRRMLALAQRNR